MIKIIYIIWYLSIFVASLCIISLYFNEREWIETFKKIIYTLVSVLIIGLILINFLVGTNLILSIRVVVLLLFGLLITNIYTVGKNIKKSFFWVFLYLIVVVAMLIFSNIN